MGDVSADKQDYISVLQQDICNTINADAWSVEHGVLAYPENLGDVDFKVSAAIDKLGLCVIVATPQLKYFGSNASGLIWAVDALNIVVSEIPITNRARANYATALSTATAIAKLLKCSTCIPQGIAQTELNGVIIVTLTCKTSYQFTN